MPRLALADDDLGRGEIVLHRRRFAQELGIEGDLVAAPGRLARGALERRQHEARPWSRAAWCCGTPAAAAALRGAARPPGRAGACSRADGVRSSLPSARDGVPTQMIAMSSRSSSPSSDGALRTPPVGHARGQQLLDHRLDHGRAPGADGGHLLRIDVDAQHVVPGLGETGGGRGADIAEAEDGDVQGSELHAERARPSHASSLHRTSPTWLPASADGASGAAAQDPGGRRVLPRYRRQLAPEPYLQVALRSSVASASTCARRRRSTISLAQGAVRNIAIRPSPLGTCCMRSTVSA